MKNISKVFSTLLLLLLTTTLVILYSDGWRLNLFPETGEEESQSGEAVSPSRIVKTGMIAVRSNPEGAKVYIDDKSITATDDTIASLIPGKYNLKIIKEGFETWHKTVNVYSELVTDITAVLVLKSPRLEPLTNTDVKAFSLSSNQNDIAFLTQNHEKPGIWLLPIGGGPINLFRNNTHLMVANSRFGTPSLGEDLWWSPDDNQILVKMNENGYLLYNLTDQSNVNLLPEAVSDPSIVIAKWQTKWQTEFVQNKLADILRKQTIPDWISEAILHKDFTWQNWSPDGEKFFLLSPNRDETFKYDLVIYNSEDPLPIDEQRVYFPLVINDPYLTKIYWYSDSYHLIVVERQNLESSYFTVSLIRIDGTNRTVVYTGNLASDSAVPTPGGDKIIVMTSLKENSPTNLYGISIR